MGNWLKTFLLLGAMTAIIMFFGQILGGQTGLVIAFVIALALNFFIYWFSADMVLAKTRARVVGVAEAPDLYNLVAHLAQNAGLPTPRVAIVKDPSPNAFATGRDPAHAVVAVTSGLLSAMTREELAGVLSHELAHVKHRDILIGSVAAVLASVILFLANMAKFAALFGGRRRGGAGNLVQALLLAFLAPLAAALIQAAISRSREYLADEDGANIAQTPMGLASALEKLQKAALRVGPPRHATPETASLFIVNPLSGRSLTALFATHPPIEERIQRLRGLRP
ncbi:MAG: M48 family metalloprotease [Deltaproteobacteria bacterium]|jgi:heat shock protein HtpX|nr:M48 family metalloprotease [Deltaproteobacteria bacterium]